MTTPSSYLISPGLVCPEAEHPWFFDLPITAWREQDIEGVRWIVLSFTSGGEVHIPVKRGAALVFVEPERQ